MLRSALLSHLGSFLLLCIVTFWLFTDNACYVALSNWSAHHSPRHWLLALFAASGIGLSLLSIVPLAFGGSRSRSLKMWFGVLTLTGVWLSLLVNHEAVVRQGLIYRARHLVRVAKNDAIALSTEWPDSQGRLRLGQYWCEPDTNFLFLTDWQPKTRWRAAIGPCIYKSHQDTISFELIDLGVAWIEYSPSCETIERKADVYALEPGWNLILPVQNSSFRAD